MAMKSSPYAVIAALILGALTPGQAQAQGDQCGVERSLRERPLDELTWRRLNRIYELAGEENYDTAHEELVRMQERASGAYLDAIISQALGQVRWARGEFEAALESFELAISLDALPDQAHFSLLYQVAQLYFMEDRYRDALNSLESWFCNTPPSEVKAAAWYLEASIHARMANWPGVVTAIDHAIETGEEPQEHWYQLKLSADFELDDMPRAAETLDTMIGNWPDRKTYWLQLSNVHIRLGNGDTALSMAALAYRKGLFDEQSDYLFLSTLYALEDVPLKAAGVIQEGIEAAIVEPTAAHWTMAGDAWYAAAELEKALAAFEHAGRAALNGDIDLRRGYILIGLERWEEARKALTAAIEKGGIDNRELGEAHLMVGIGEFNLGNFDRAAAAWGRAGRFETIQGSARQWLNHLREERARQAP
jgi:tetratricopeptide (TPR) repeat protein